jgi:hypothetical protein
MAVLAGRGDVEMMFQCGVKMIDPYGLANSFFGSETMSLRTMPGGGRTANILEGYRWITRAAMMNHVGAQNKPGEFFERGVSLDGRQVIAPDFVKADIWYCLAVHGELASYRASSVRLEEGFKPVGLSEAMAMAIALPLVDRTE